MKRCMVLLLLIFLKPLRTAAQNAPVVWADSCVGGSFFGKISADGFSDFSQVHQCSNGDFIAVGTFKRRYAQLEIQKNYCNVMRITAAGNMVWSRFVGIVDPAIQVDLRAYTSVIAANGDLLLVLAISAMPLSGNYVVRLDGDGQLIWQKRLPYLNSTSFSDTFKDMIITSDGGFVLTGVASTKGVIIKLNAVGEMLWRRTLISWDADINGIAEGSDGYYFMGEITNRTSGFVENYIAKANKDSGSATAFRWITLAGAAPLSQVSEYRFEDIQIRNGKIAITGSTRESYTGARNNAQAVIYIDEQSSNVLSAKRIENLSVEQSPSAYFQGRVMDPFLNIGVQFTVADSSDYYVYRLDNNYYPVIAWKILQPGAQSAKDLLLSVDSTVIIAGYDRSVTNTVSASLLKTSSNGKLEGCSNTPYLMSVTNLPVSLVPTTNAWYAAPLPGNSSTSSLDTLAGNGFTWQLDCWSSSCRLSKIQGAASVCVSSGNVFAVTSAGCNGPIRFSTSDPGAAIQRLTDNSVRVTFSRTGAFMLRAALQATCGELVDSMLVQVTSNSDTLSLGEDAELCAANTKLLQPGANFKNYLWQDGSTGATFLVKTAGRYFVAADGVCGNRLSDTINIIAAPFYRFSAGADRIKCSGDTVQLIAEPVYSNYLWSPNYNIVSNLGGLAVVNPLVDTVYTVTASVYPGCLVFDTVFIKVNARPLLELGADRNSCSGEVIALNAGPGFAQYRWNNGSVSPTIVVSGAGIYSVEAITQEGCKSTASVRITQTPCLNDVYVPSVFSPNGDRLNELFKPLTSLPLIQYDFRVFDRWGKLLFSSKTPGVGWDGKYKGEPLEAATLVWICSYQVSGREPVVKKGSVILLR